jgi:hypothetical protein
VRIWASLIGGLLALGGGGVAGTGGLKRVSGRATTVASVCGGGAAISREQIARLPPPQPVGGREFLVVAGERITAARPAARFTTRADGTFVTQLPPGKWCLFDASRRPSEPRGDAAQPPAPPADTDAACLAAQKQRCDLVLAVKDDVRDAAIIFTQRCPQPWNQPCYRGPMPP